MFFFETGLSSIRAASTPNRSQEFQVGYLKCRSDFLQALSQLVYTCHSLRTSPPPAIASSQAKVCTGFFLVKSQRKFVTLCPRCPKIKMNDKKKSGPVPIPLPRAASNLFNAKKCGKIRLDFRDNPICPC